MNLHGLQIKEWKQLSEPELQACAEAVAAQVPVRVEFAGLRDSSYAGRQMRVARFLRDGAQFSLLPGGEVRLGYDAAGSED
jgi:hypothetical protein